MPKNKTSGISEILKEQAKERFNSSNHTNDNVIKDEAKQIDQISGISAQFEKIRKNFYIEKNLVKLLKKMAYEKDTDQTKLVNEALKMFFRSHGYITD